MLVLGLILGSCVATTANVAINDIKRDVCNKLFLQISWSTKDTDETIRGVKASNRRQKSYCKGI